MEFWLSLFIILWYCYLGSKIVQLESEINVLEDFAIKNSCSKCLKRYENSSDLITCPKCSIINYCSNDCLVRNLRYVLHILIFSGE
jgi:hypothetical protein